MKLKQQIRFKNKLLNLKLIETKTYKIFNNLKIENIGFRLKKAFHIIYKYHINNKQILFIGTPLKFNKKLKHLFLNTKHTIVPEPLWINGGIHNRFLNNNTKLSKLLLKLKQTPDLIVVINNKSNITALKEGYKTKILTISFNYSLKNIGVSYKIPGNFKIIQKQIRNNFFYSILIAIIKKSKTKL